MQTDSLNNQSELEVEIERLYLFQDKPLGKERKSMISMELLDSGLPVGALIQGVRQLQKEELSFIKLNRIISTARQFVFTGEEKKSCDECISGFIVMKDDEGRNFSLSCACEAGFQKKKANRLAPWNGESSQFSNGRLLTILVERKKER